jgi:hypothetical protein
LAGLSTAEVSTPCTRYTPEGFSFKKCVFGQDTKKDTETNLIVESEFKIFSKKRIPCCEGDNEIFSLAKRVSATETVAAASAVAITTAAAITSTFAATIVAAITAKVNVPVSGPHRLLQCIYARDIQKENDTDLVVFSQLDILLKRRTSLCEGDEVLSLEEISTKRVAATEADAAASAIAVTVTSTFAAEKYSGQSPHKCSGSAVYFQMLEVFQLREKS